MLSASEFYKIQRAKKAPEVLESYKSVVEIVNLVASKVNEKWKAQVPSSQAAEKRKKKKNKPKRCINDAAALKSVKLQVRQPEARIRRSTKKRRRKSKQIVEANTEPMASTCPKLSSVESSEPVPQLVEGDEMNEIEVRENEIEMECIEEVGDDYDVTDDCEINPVDHGRALFQLLLDPFDLSTFSSHFNGIKHLHVKGGAARQNFNRILSLSEVNTWLLEEHMVIGRDVELLGPPDAQTPLPKGRAFCSLIWNQFNLGYSLRINGPERFSHRLAETLSLLQEFIHGPISSYLVFANSSFKGHLLGKSSPLMGDIFVVQLEGTLEVSIKKPPGCNEAESENVSLVSGDVLYLPHKFEHSVQVSSKSNHAVQLCIVNHMPAILDEHLARLVADLGLKCDPESKMLTKLITAISNVDHAVPHLFPGLKTECLESSLRVLLGGTVDKPAKTAKKIRAAVEAFKIDLVRRMRAPALHESESCGHVSRQGEVWLDPNQTISEDADLEEVDVPPSRPQQEGRVALGVELEPETPIRLVRQTAACISVCGSRFRIFHALYNSLDIRDTNETHYLELSSENLQAVKAILDAYPASIEICDLPGSSIDSKMVLANSLYETGLIITTQPLPPCPWDASSSEDIEME